MQNDAANIYCPNPNCEAPNLEANHFCQKCRTPLPRRFLWALYEGKVTWKPGEILAERYLYKGEKVFLDLKPGVSPVMPEEVPPSIAPYLKLFPERLHVPQVYGLLPRSQSRQAADIWLLEQAPIAAKSGSDPDAPPTAQLRPQLTAVWKKASPMRQLNWLWQIAKLWQPASDEGVASSLLDETLLRGEGPLVRLLHLQNDRLAPTLSQLGQVWARWVADAHPLIAPFLERLCQQMVRKRVQTGQQLVAVLDRALAVCARSQERSYQIATGSDTGPSRRRNEDACYPPSGTLETPSSEPLAIVCDGIGGHEGGNVASHLAIDTIRDRLANINLQTPIADLERITCIANDAISDRNNDEQRQGRQRMGTTVVMALGNGHEVYVTHVGDSRAYWIGREGCYQITLDDDVASREVRLGYALYRDAIQQPASGSLVQALGMNASGLLHPTVGRFVIDEDSLFLLCSDGLSDNDRIEQSWDSEILPVLLNPTDLAGAVKRLIWLANTQNGHDNVTVALLYCKVRDSQKSPVTAEELLAELETVLSSLPDEPALAGSETTQLPDATSEDAATVLQLVPRRPASPLPWLLAIALLLLALVGGSVLAYVLSPPALKQKIDPWIGRYPTPSPSPTPASPSELLSPDASTPQIALLEVNSLLQIQSSTPHSGESHASTGPKIRETASATSPVKAIVPEGSIVKVLNKTTADNARWIQLQVCSSPPTDPSAQPLDFSPQNAASPKKNSPERSPDAASSQPTPPATPPLLQPGDKGWILETEIVPLPFTQPAASPEQLGKCAATPAPSVAPSPTPTPTPTDSR